MTAVLIALAIMAGLIVIVGALAFVLRAIVALARLHS